MLKFYFLALSIFTTPALAELQEVDSIYRWDGFACVNEDGKSKSDCEGKILCAKTEKGFIFNKQIINILGNSGYFNFGHHVRIENGLIAKAMFGQSNFNLSADWVKNQYDYKDEFETLARPAVLAGIPLFKETEQFVPRGPYTKRLPKGSLPGFIVIAEFEGTKIKRYRPHNFIYHKVESMGPWQMPGSHPRIERWIMLERDLYQKISPQCEKFVGSTRTIQITAEVIETVIDNINHLVKKTLGRKDGFFPNDSVDTILIYDLVVENYFGYILSGATHSEAYYELEAMLQNTTEATEKFPKRPKPTARGNWKSFSAQTGIFGGTFLALLQDLVGRGIIWKHTKPENLIKELSVFMEVYIRMAPNKKDISEIHAEATRALGIARSRR